MRSLCYLVLLLVVRVEGELRRDDFPEKFVFGAGTSAYQWEGAVAEDGRTPSIWDTFCHSGKMLDNSTGDTTADGYHKYKEDVELMAEAGIEAYRFSISWSRLIPNGRGAVNPLGLQYYNNLIDELISHGIQPHVTLLHYDYPQVLQDEYGGWFSPKIVDDFTAYANVCFREFGDRISFWTTLNEPNVFAMGGSNFGVIPPENCTDRFGVKCTVGGTYIIAHNMLLSHASAASLYRSKFQEKQRGFIGLNILAPYFLPMTNSFKAMMATRRAFDFYIGWLMEPLVRGNYPANMKRRAGKKLPSFSRSQKRQLKNSYDFFGLNYYSTMWVDDANHGIKGEGDFSHDLSVKLEVKEEGSPENKFNSFGLEGLLAYVKMVYSNPLVFIHENGYVMPHNTTLEDASRVLYMSAHIESLRDAVRSGSNVKGYFTWSLMDVFEILFGYEQTYGLYYVDFADKDLKRIPKLSAHWYSNFLKGKDDTIRSKIPFPTSVFSS